MLILLVKPSGTERISMGTIVIVVLVIFLLGGGGYWYRGRRV